MLEYYAVFHIILFFIYFGERKVEQKPAINVAFCLDSKFLMQTCVSITSLLTSAKDKCRYNIYCVLGKDISKQNRKELEDSVFKFSNDSKIIFLNENGSYDNAHIPPGRDEWSKAVYYRLMLPDLIPNADKVIYIDSDTIILRDLIEMNNIDFNDNYVLGCLDFLNDDVLWEQKYGNYWLHLEKRQCINTGMMIMNLKKIRQDNLSEKWIELAKKEVRCVDQDVINSTCLGKIGLLPTIYNRAVVDKTKIKSAITEEDLQKIVILHYVYPKPWIEKGKLSDLWWNCAEMTDFYPQLNLNYSINRLKQTKNKESEINAKPKAFFEDI